MRHQIINLSNPLWMQTLKQLRHDIYHLPEYFYLEATRSNSIAEAILISDEEKLFFFPYLLRECNNLFDDALAEETLDIVSPNGYAGILLSETAKTLEFTDSAIKRLIQVLQQKNVCSAFLRLHSILNQDFDKLYNFDFCQLSGETISINLKLSEVEIWQQTRPEHRNKINRCKRLGLTARMVPFKEYVREFNEIYEETMDRVGATNFYYFGYDYFWHLQRMLGEYIHLCIVELSGQIACAGLFTECSQIVQYHLGGTRSKFLQQAPSKLMFNYVSLWAKKRGNEVFHLGGGVGGAKDSLYHFKAGFSQQRHAFLTLRIIVNQSQYYHLVNLRAKYLKTEVHQLLSSSFFPAYRASPIN